MAPSHIFESINSSSSSSLAKITPGRKISLKIRNTKTHIVSFPNPLLTPFLSFLEEIPPTDAGEEFIFYRSIVLFFLFHLPVLLCRISLCPRSSFLEWYKGAMGVGRPRETGIIFCRGIIAHAQWGEGIPVELARRRHKEII